jgi:hypothetical protein
MSVEARLQALVQAYRAQHGDAGLHNAPQLIAQLSSQAPDLYGEVRALAAAVAGNAAARVGASPDQAGEAGRVATEIAASEKLSLGVAAAGVAVARALGPIGGPAAPAMPPAPPAAGGGWAGETVVAGAPATAPPGGYAPPPQQPPYGQVPGYPPAAGGYVPPGSMPPPGHSGSAPIYKNKVAIGVAAAVVLFLGYAYTQRTPTGSRSAPPTNTQGPLAGGGGAPQSGVPGGSGPQGGGAPGGGQQGAAGQYPMLTRGGGALPSLQINRMPTGLAIPFLIETQAGPAPGGIILPAGGWDQGAVTVVFGRAGDTTGQGQIVNQGTVQMERAQGQNGPARSGVVQWQQDGLGMGPICVAFSSNGQSQSGDVGLSGTTMCVLDASCQQPAGCGQVR